MKKLSQIFSIETKEKRYFPFVIRFLIEIFVFGGVTLIIYFLVPAKTPFRFFIIIPLFLVFGSVIMFFCRCLNVSDNKEKAKLFRNKFKEKHKNILIEKMDFIFWIKNAELFETAIIKSPTKYGLIEVYIYKGARKVFFNDKEYKDIDYLISILELQEFIVENCITVCETFDRNNPELLKKEIETLKSKNRL